MAYIRELPQARNFDISSKSISFGARFFVWEAINEVDVQATVLLYTPIIYRQLVRERMKAEEVGPGMWMVDIPYASIDRNSSPGVDTGQAQPPEANGPLNGINTPKFSFDTTGETKHITQSLATRSATTIREGSDATIDNSNAINVSNERVEGCDVISPKFDMTVEVPFPEVTMAYIIGLYNLTGTVNYEQRFCGFEKGEVLYRGATGQFTVDNKWVITHHVSCRPNRKDFDLTGAKVPTPGASVPVGTTAGVGTMKIKEVKGWDFLWVEYRTATVGIRQLQVPYKAFVEVVYPTGDFSILTGGPALLAQKLQQNGINPGDPAFFADMSEQVKKVVRIAPDGGLPGTLVEWNWSDPRLP